MCLVTPRQVCMLKKYMNMKKYYQHLGAFLDLGGHHSGDSLNNIVTWLPVDDDAAKSEPIRQKNYTRSLFQRLRGKK